MDRIQPVKGTRDLYPADLAPLNYLFDAWRRVSIRHGFVEFDGPTLEPLDLYTRKSGDEIVSQLFHLQDRAGRSLALRPELTPSLARMVAARAGSLPRPIKWFSIPRLYRGENPQRGRLREFFQWNVDILGSDERAADAEVIAVAAESFRELGLTAADAVIRISDRRLIATMLDVAGVPESEHPAAYALLDKAADADPARFAENWNAGPGRWLEHARLAALLVPGGLDELAGHARSAGLADARLNAVIEDARRLMALLAALDVIDFCAFDVRIVRGLAYYTGPVFEAYDRAGKERAICGGGRYDRLLEMVGGAALPAVGFGMGDVVLSLMLSERGLLPDLSPRLDVFIVAEPEAFDAVPRLAARLRRRGLACDYDLKRRTLRKQLEAADARRARFAAILAVPPGDAGSVALKELATSRQVVVPIARLESEPPDRWLA